VRITGWLLKLSVAGGPAAVSFLYEHCGKTLNFSDGVVRFAFRSGSPAALGSILALWGTRIDVTSKVMELVPWNTMAAEVLKSSTDTREETLLSRVSSWTSLGESSTQRRIRRL
jgi:hypothetical protein